MLPPSALPDRGTAGCRLGAAPLSKSAGMTSCSSPPASMQINSPSLNDSQEYDVGDEPGNMKSLMMWCSLYASDKLSRKPPPLLALPASAAAAAAREPPETRALGVPPAAPPALLGVLPIPPGWSGVSGSCAWGSILRRASLRVSERVRRVHKASCPPHHAAQTPRPNCPRPIPIYTRSRCTHLTPSPRSAADRMLQGAAAAGDVRKLEKCPHRAVSLCRKIAKSE